MAKAKILVVEDEALVAEDLEMAVTDLGYEVVDRAASADDAVKMAVELVPDLILMDIVLKGQKTGIDASYEIKAKLDIPTLFLTAYTDITLIEKAKSTEPYAYLVKPFNGKQLLAAIEMALYKSKIEKRLKESEGKLNAMLQSIGDHVSMIDKNLNILWANETAQKIFGNDITGRKCYEVYHHRKEPCEPYPCLTLKAFQDGKIHEHDTQVIAKSGELMYFHCTANVALRDKKGAPTGVIEISSDITERKHAEENLKQLTLTLQEHVEKLEESKKGITKAYSLREHFLKETSHRIITPVSIIGGYADVLLENSNLDAEQKEKIRIIREKNAEIQKLVRDALTKKYSEEPGDNSNLPATR
jgi:PAS domain S-box-containing protein